MRRRTLAAAHPRISEERSEALAQSAARQRRGGARAAAARFARCRRRTHVARRAARARAEHGLAGWAALKEALEDSAATQPIARPGRWFLENACPDHHVAAARRRHGAAHGGRILRQHPDVARHSLYTAIVCGDLDEVERLLTARPRPPSEQGGPQRWEPLLYLCFTRLPLAAARDNAVADRARAARPRCGSQRLLPGRRTAATRRWSA